MERFVDKNLNVTSKHIFLFFCCGRHSKGREGMVLVGEKHLRACEKGGRGRLSSPPFSLASGLAPKLPNSFPFRTPSTQAKDNQVILKSYSSSLVIDINFTRCNFNPRILIRF